MTVTRLSVVVLMALSTPVMAADTAASHYLAGQDAYKAANYAGAVREYQAALSLKPTSIPVKDGLIAAMDARLKELEGRIRQLEKALADQPKAGEQADPNVKRTEIRIIGRAPSLPSTRPSTAAPQPQAQASDFPTGLVVNTCPVLPINRMVTPNHGEVVGRYAKPSITNRGTVKYKQVVVYVNLYDREGTQIDHGWDVINTLAPGETATTKIEFNTRANAKGRVTRIEAVPVK